ncbi:MAG: NADH-quinone oxidoreductase subunit NuoN [Bacteroidetes bacterium]|jgi:NADH-quinone oxidoreductase subunit N|nr:NADH-quinone oxidoreductase subunit NuoN [Bacteroidota bacterium]
MDLSEAYLTLWSDLDGVFSMALVSLVGLIVVVVDAFRNDHPSLPWMGAAALLASIGWELSVLGDAPGTALFGAVRTGGFAAFVNLIILVSGLLTIVLSVPYLDQLKRAYGEVYALILFATAGMIMLGTANTLISVFVGLETMSICLYIMTGLVREDEGSIESALKYFLLGAFSTGFFLYGIALLYGATGTMVLPEMAAGLEASGSTLLFWGGVALLLIGFMFKVSAVPFHMWTPDVYQGAPTTLTGYMSTASKASAFASLILVLFYALPTERWSLVLAFIAVVTMVLGNVLALSQPNVKRMLAYSSVAHAGYVLVGLTAASPAGYAGALYYLLVYAVMNIGAFGVMAFLEWDGKEGREQTLDSLAGIGFRRPALGASMGFFMFSLTGLPPLAGFTGKWFVFAPAVNAGLTWLVFIAVLMSAVSAYYYLRVVYVFWMLSPEDVPEAAEAQNAAFPVPASSIAVIVACAVTLLVLFVLSGNVMGFAEGLFEEAASMASMP